ncbi:MAG: hypothetical protein MUC63_08100 [Planctomycetes bacterium]|jgi:hypothetical protein|nr:hypothetical protein [Planctomycetota bacterium]
MRIGWLGCLALGLVVPGCLSFGAAMHYPFLHTEYAREGFAVSDDARVFRFDRQKNLAVLETRGLRLEDQQNDGQVDRVKSGKNEYFRGETGTSALFLEMDRLWAETAEWLSVAHFKRVWEEQKPEAIVDRSINRPPVK